jgi:1-acyl-sn-glycerol-3-phosphate acyltransferase
MHPGLYLAIRRVVHVLARLLYRIEIVGSVPSGPVIVAANHESMLDPPLLALVSHRPLHFLAKVELWRYPPGAWLMDALGGIPIRRDRRDLLSVDRAEELLRAGESIAIFPQGTVQGGAWTRGAARLALATGAPLVPVRIVGTKRALSTGRLSFPKIRLIVGEPIPVEQAKPTVAAARELTAELEKRVDAAR